MADAVFVKQLLAVGKSRFVYAAVQALAAALGLGLQQILTWARSSEQQASSEGAGLQAE